MNIPDNAVQAAIDALPYQAADYVDTDTMRAAIAAAVPHMQMGAVREMAIIARERKCKLDAVTSIAVRLGESMQGDDRELSEELYAAMGLK